MRILGIDPGTATTGFGLIDYQNSEYTLLDFGCIVTRPNQALSVRLKQIGRDLKTIIMTWKPDVVAIEELFFSKNVKTALQVAHARGAIMQQLSLEGYEVAEYKPQQVKEAICGYGRAEKLQIQKMVQMMFELETLPTPDDAADAIAIAVCHANSLKSHQLLHETPAYSQLIS